MYEKNSSDWYLHQVAQLTSRRLTPVRVIACSPPSEVRILVKEHDPETVARTERLLSTLVDAGTSARLVSQQDYDRDVRVMREANALG
jgi:hypothetical protein